MSHDSAGVVMGGRRVAKDGRGDGTGRMDRRNCPSPTFG